jgi:hypothetical protein
MVRGGLVEPRIGIGCGGGREASYFGGRRTEKGPSKGSRGQSRQELSVVASLDERPRVGTIRLRMVSPIWSVVAEINEARLVGMECESIPCKALTQNA